MEFENANSIRRAIREDGCIAGVGGNVDIERPHIAGAGRTWIVHDEAADSADPPAAARGKPQSGATILRDFEGAALIVIDAVAKTGAGAFGVAKIQATKRDFEQTALVNDFAVVSHSRNAAGTSHDYGTGRFQVTAQCHCIIWHYVPEGGLADREIYNSLII